MSAVETTGRTLAAEASAGTPVAAPAKIPHRIVQETHRFQR
jgi:hypothetical protein